MVRLNLQYGDSSGAAIICGHVAIDGLPILRAIRDEPAEPPDSGWQFLCDCGEDEDVDRGRVWSVNEVIKCEPTLAGLTDLPPGTELARKDRDSPWRVVRSGTTLQ